MGALSNYMALDFSGSPQRIVSVVLEPPSDGGIGNTGGTAGTYDIRLGNTRPSQLNGGTAGRSVVTDGTLFNFSSATTTTQTITSSGLLQFFPLLQSSKYVWIWTETNGSQSAWRLAEFQATVVDIKTTEAALPVVTIDERPEHVETFAGRVWYAGINNDDLSSRLYFSQVILNDADYAKCHQNQDPTSVEFNALQDDDGGFVSIPEMGCVEQLFAYRDSLFIFSTNGVWRLQGGSGGFTAGNFSVEKISSVGTYSSLSFVDVEGFPYWWGEDGIHRLEFNPNFNSFSVVSLSDEKIRQFIIDIPTLNRRYVKGSYDVHEDTVEWIYNSASSLAQADYYKYDKILTLNVPGNFFYPGTIGGTTPDIRGTLFVRDSKREVGDLIKYPTSLGNDLTYSDQLNTSYQDWTQYAVNVATPAEEIDYTSFFITGYKPSAEMMKFFQVNYIIVFLDTIANSQAYFQSISDFTNTPNSGKWTVRQQVYNSALTNRDVNYRRLKVRGKGRFKQFRFESLTGQPFRILGWSAWETGNQGA
jgi:hypothetical protein